MTNFCINFDQDCAASGTAEQQLWVATIKQAIGDKDWEFFRSLWAKEIFEMLGLDYKGFLRELYKRKEIYEQANHKSTYRCFV